MTIPKFEGEPTRAWSKALAGVDRFNTLPMTHRTNVHTHALRVAKLSLAIANIALRSGYEVDKPKVLRMAIHHDDPEVVTTDIPSPKKRAMTTDERAILRREEIAALIQNGPRFTPLPTDVYVADNEELSRKDSTASHIIDIADKTDGLCETLHEIRAGAGKPYYDVLENYKNIFSEIGQYPIFDELDIQVPSTEEARKMRRVHVELLEEDRIEEFWRDVFDDNLPDFYLTWMRLTMGNGLFLTLERGIDLFPGWKRQLRAASARQLGRPSLSGTDSLLSDIRF